MLSTNQSQLEYNESIRFYREVMDSFKMDFSFYEDLIEVLKPQSVLEFGCGTGRLFPIFLQQATDVAGIDVSDEMIAKGREYFDTHRPESTCVEFFNANMCTFDAGKTYDLVVFALSVLKHLKTDEERVQALASAKRHLNKGGVIVLDQTELLYASGPVSWTDAQDSMVKDWVQDVNVLEGYQWRKTIDGDRDILEWRRSESGNVLFESKFTTYRYSLEDLTRHLEQLDLRHECLMTEWGVNGLSNQGKRFIGFAHQPSNQCQFKDALQEKVKQRDEQLWSNYELYVANTERESVLVGA